jgi:hypothetical protein
MVSKPHTALAPDASSPSVYASLLRSAQADPRASAILDVSAGSLAYAGLADQARCTLDVLYRSGRPTSGRAPEWS